MGFEGDVKHAKTAQTVRRALGHVKTVASDMPNAGHIFSRNIKKISGLM